ncbi:hypothetical protein AMJ80_12290 [bacterium SM23_31]|nr:MAG: hypothetical protein AMJ80_12290 [bacterium SM23_31]
MTLSVIIVSYNVKNYLEQALVSVQKALSGISHEIFVVDNASTDGSAAVVKEKFPGVMLIENEKNTGFARANNIAVKRAAGEYISLLNPDTIVQEDTFSILLEAFSTYPEAGMVGCKILNEDGSLQLSCRRSFPTPWVSLTRMLGLSKMFPNSRLFARYNMTYLDADNIEEVDAVSGSFMTIRREILETVGFLDERFFMYGEDLDWCYRIKQAGWKILYYPKTSIIHFKGKSASEKDWNQIKLFHKAMVIFAEKHLRHSGIITPLWLLKTAVRIKAVLTYIRRKALR